MDKFLIQLKRDPSVELNCTFYASPGQSSPRNTLVVCLGGIDNPQSIWEQTITHFLHSIGSPNPPPILTYDRPGIEKFNRTKPAVSERAKSQGRDCLDAAHDLRDVISQVAKLRLGVNESDIDNLRIVFVAFSMGVAIARLYCAEYPKTVSGLLILDSTIANLDTDDMLPDPRAPGFVKSDLPAGITVEVLEEARKIFARVYGIHAPNREGLYRGNVPSLLPHPDSPKLQGPGPRTPYVTVVVHDTLTAASQSKKAFGFPEIVSIHLDPVWRNYHEGLARLTKSCLSKGPVVAKGCGHLIPKDGPQLVADELREILDKLANNEATHI